LGEPILTEIKNYLLANPRRNLAHRVAAPLDSERRQRLNDSQTETLRRFEVGESVEQISRARGFVPSTIYSHLLAAIECGKLAQTRERFFTAAQEKEIAAAFRQVSGGALVDISGLLGGKYEIGLLRIFRAFAARSNQRAICD
jgi:hypothetical protein